MQNANGADFVLFVVLSYVCAISSCYGCNNRLC